STDHEDLIGSVERGMVAVGVCHSAVDEDVLGLLGGIVTPSHMVPLPCERGGLEWGRTIVAPETEIGVVIPETQVHREADVSSARRAKDHLVLVTKIGTHDPGHARERAVRRRRWGQA